MNLLLKAPPFFLLIIILFSCSRKETDTKKENDAIAPLVKQDKTMRTFPGGSCQDCNLMFLGMPLQFGAVDTTSGWSEEGQKLIVQGTVYKDDQKTPASDVILYFYHTDHTGRYTPAEGMLPSARRHGHLRAWVKTGADGRYALYTNRPAPYPNEKIEARIHVFVKEPYLDVPYEIDDWIFEDDPLVTKETKSHLENRGGNCILKINLQNDVQVSNHDIILGLNIPGYPK
jgi:protocatechuate 3,4-dioxygenase, beta subunit